MRSGPPPFHLTPFLSSLRVVFENEDSSEIRLVSSYKEALPVKPPSAPASFAFLSLGLLGRDVLSWATASGLLACRSPFLWAEPAGSTDSCRVGADLPQPPAAHSLALRLPEALRSFAWTFPLLGSGSPRPDSSGSSLFKWASHAEEYKSGISLEVASDSLADGQDPHVPGGSEKREAECKGVADSCARTSD